VRAELLSRRGNSAAAIALAAEAVALRREADAPGLLAQALAGQGAIHDSAGDPGGARAAYAEARSLFAAKGDVASISRLADALATSPGSARSG
jgi:Flp pilus assembly protein TadD